MVSKDDGEIIRCSKCRTILDKTASLEYSERTPYIERTPCPVCGSCSWDHAREVNVSIAVSIADIKEKARRGGKGRPFIEERKKREVYQETGEEHDVDRIFDREHNLYKEIITDSKTGEVLCEHCEALDKHRNHGYAKGKSKKSER